MEEEEEKGLLGTMEAEEEKGASLEKQRTFRDHMPLGTSGIRRGAFGPDNRATERCALVLWAVVMFGVSGMMLYTMYQFFALGRVQVGIESEALTVAEVPSVMMCPYSTDASFLTGAAAGSMKGVVNLAGYPKEVEGYCQIETSAGGEEVCNAALLSAEQAAPPCCCYQKASGLSDTGFHCVTHPRLPAPCRGADRECFCLDMHMFRMHNNGGHHRETFEVRTTYNVQLDDGDGTNNAMKVGLYSNYSQQYKSFFYIEAGYFAIGYLEKAIYHHLDWFSREQYDSFSVQMTTIEEPYHRGELKCSGLPPLSLPQNKNMSFDCASEGCKAALRPKGSQPATNFCTRFSMSFGEYFITKGVSFGSMYNWWAIMALVSVLATQLNNLNIFNLIFPYRQNKDTRQVNSFVYYLTCGAIRSNHEAESDDEV